MQIRLTADERNLGVSILEDRERMTRKKGLAAEDKWVSSLRDKVVRNESQFSINEVEFLREILTNCVPDDLRRICGAHEVARERQILDDIVERLNEAHVVTG